MNAIRLLTLLSSAALLLPAACLENGGGDVDSETHFLAGCASDSDCGALGLSCLCGICTTPCVAGDSCGAPADGQCVDAGATSLSCATTAAPPAICLPTCGAPSGCTPYGDALTCDDGFCVPIPVITLTDTTDATDGDVSDAVASDAAADVVADASDAGADATDAGSDAFDAAADAADTGDVTVEPCTVCGAPCGVDASCRPDPGNQVLSCVHDLTAPAVGICVNYCANQCEASSTTCGSPAPGCSCGVCPSGFGCFFGQCTSLAICPGDPCDDGLGGQFCEGQEALRACAGQPDAYQRCTCSGGGDDSVFCADDCGPATQVPPLLQAGMPCSASDQCLGGNCAAGACGETCSAADTTCPSGKTCLVPGDIAGVCVPTCTHCGTQQGCSPQSTCAPLGSSGPELERLACVPDGLAPAGQSGTCETLCQQLCHTNECGTPTPGCDCGECAAGQAICTSGLCVPTGGRPDGAPCAFASQCASDLCLADVCGTACSFTEPTCPGGQVCIIPGAEAGVCVPTCDYCGDTDACGVGQKCLPAPPPQGGDQVLVCQSVPQNHSATASCRNHCDTACAQLACGAGAGGCDCGSCSAGQACSSGSCEDIGTCGGTPCDDAFGGKVCEGTAFFAQCPADEPGELPCTCTGGGTSCESPCQDTWKPATF